MAQMMCGGTGALKEADGDIQALCDELKDQLGKDRNFSMMVAVSYKSQLVAGTNFFVKIQVSESGECIHARIFKPLPCYGVKSELHGVQEGKNLESALEHF